MTPASISLSAAGFTQQHTDSAASRQQASEVTSSVTPAAAQPALNEDDDFYILYQSSWRRPGALKQEGVDYLTKNYPDIFHGVDLNPLTKSGDSIMELFDDDPVKYQPIARLIAQGHEGSIRALNITFGIYKDDFYSITWDSEGTENVIVHKDAFLKSKADKRFVSELREFLFDESLNNDDKVTNLQMLFPPVNQSEEDFSIEQLCENMNLLLGSGFKQAQQRAIDAGIKP